MVCKKNYCSICDKYVLNKSSHNKTKLHNQLFLSVVNKYHIENVPVTETNNIINKRIIDYNEKLLNFVCWCKIQNENFCDKKNLGWIDRPDVKIGEKILSKHNCDRNEFVHFKIISITDFDCLSYNHSLQQPKPMIEKKICKIIDQNPNLIKTLDNMPEPYKKHIIVKHWGFRAMDCDGIICDFIPSNWRDIDNDNNNI